MTHTVVRLAQLAEDTSSPIGYSPTGNQLLLTGTDEQPLTGRVFTTPIVRQDDEPEGSGAAATDEQLEALRREETSCLGSGLVVERVHGEVQLPALPQTLVWLAGVQGSMISVDVWKPAPGQDDAPAWHHSTVQLLLVRNIVLTFTGDVQKHPLPGDVEHEHSTWYRNQRLTSTPPPVV